VTREAVLFFDGVFMIESLPLGERKTGTFLFDETIAPSTLTSQDFSPAFRSAYGRDEFFKAIDELRVDFAAKGRSPILHIEAHGDEHGEGVVLGSGEFVAWTELRPVMEEINRLTKFNLLVVMATCKGAYLIQSMRPTQRAPFWGVIGPNRTVYDIEMQRALDAFYRKLVATQDGTDAMTSLNVASQASGEHYKLLDAELYFCWIYEKHEEGTSPADVEDRVNRVVAAWAHEFGPDIRKTAIVRETARKHVLNHERWYKHLGQHFLMLDLFPENKGRFKLSYRECVGRVAV
jgi:hypothetical protein